MIRNVIHSYEICIVHTASPIQTQKYLDVPMVGNIDRITISQVKMISQ